MEPELDFSLLDDLLPLVGGADQEATQTILTARATTIGPIVEYLYHARTDRLRFPQLYKLPDSPPVREFRRILKCRDFAGMGVSTSHEACTVELHWCPPFADAFSSPAWIMFLRRLQHGAQQAGFLKRASAGLAGAFGEMADNAFRHSLRASTAVVGYSWSPGIFEYCVADAGQGVLASLHSHTDYQGIQDVGHALFV